MNDGCATLSVYLHVVTAIQLNVVSGRGISTHQGCLLTGFHPLGIHELISPQGSPETGDIVNHFPRFSTQVFVLLLTSSPFSVPSPCQGSSPRPIPAPRPARLLPEGRPPAAAAVPAGATVAARGTDGGAHLRLGLAATARHLYPTLGSACPVAGEQKQKCFNYLSLTRRREQCERARKRSLAITH